MRMNDDDALSLGVSERKLSFEVGCGGKEEEEVLVENFQFMVESEGGASL